MINTEKNLKNSSENEVMKSVKDLICPKGYCTKCGESMGFIEDYKVFCYNCEGFKKLNNSICIAKCESKLQELRLRFRNGIKNGNAKRYLTIFLGYGEKWSRNKNSLKSSNSESFHNPTYAKWDAHIYVITNIGIKWILEDLNYCYMNNYEFSNEILSIPNEWIILYSKKTNLENDLGYYIKDKEGKIYFYYFETWMRYGDSLNQYGIIDPDNISSQEYMELTNKIKEQGSDIDYMANFIRNKLPIFFISTLYFIYPDKEENMFHFNDVFNVSQTEVKQSIVELYSLARIYTFYNHERNQVEKTTEEELLFIQRTFTELKIDLKDLPWEDKLLPYLLISSQSNPTSFPLLILFKDKILISPSRLKIAVILMYEKFFHKRIHDQLKEEYEMEFQNHVKDYIRSKGVVVYDPVTNIEWSNIMDKKSSTFEFDLLGLFKNFIFIIECKSFRPSHFYHLKPARERRKKRFIRSSNQYTQKIKPWLITKFRSSPKDGYLVMNCYKKNLGSISLHIPDKFHNLSEDNIIGLYISQLDEWFKIESNMLQLSLQDLDDFLYRLKEKIRKK